MQLQIMYSALRRTPGKKALVIGYTLTDIHIGPSRLSSSVRRPYEIVRKQGKNSTAPLPPLIRILADNWLQLTVDDGFAPNMAVRVRGGWLQFTQVYTTRL